MRAFIGVLAPPNVQNVAEKVQEELKGMGVIGKYVEKENLHVNLSFLGEVSEEDSQEIASKMDMIAKGYEKFTATVCAVRPIPNAKIVRVIALDVEQEKNLLRSLGGDIKKVIGGDVKPPHMTLCRVREFSDKRRFLQVVEKYNTACFAAFEISSIQLIKSELGRDGPKYVVLHESGFSG